MFVYGTNLKIKNTILLHPNHLVDINKPHLNLGKGNNLIVVKLKSIDLYYDVSYKEYINNMKKRVGDAL